MKKIANAIKKYPVNAANVSKAKSKWLESNILKKTLPAFPQMECFGHSVIIIKCLLGC